MYQLVFKRCVVWLYNSNIQSIGLIILFFFSTDNVNTLRRCITSGFFANAAYLHYTGVYRTVRDDHELYIHPTSVLTFIDPPKWYVTWLQFNRLFNVKQSHGCSTSCIEKIRGIISILNCAVILLG